MDRETAEKAYRLALDDAARQLSYRDLSAAKLREKLLQKEHSEEAADYALAWLCERGLLDDSRFAASLVSSYARRGYGRLRIQQELYRRGIDREDMDTALELYHTDTDTLVQLLHKRLKGQVSDPKAVQRAVAFLQRRGFQWGDIRSALEEYKASIQDEPSDFPE